MKPAVLLKMKQAVLLICICLALCASAAKAADTYPPSWLQASFAEGKASAMSGYGEEREAFCFKTKRLCTAQSSSPNASPLFVKFRWFDLECARCPEQSYSSHYGGEDEGAFSKGALTTFSKCMWSIIERAQSDCRQVSPGVGVCGTYQGQCYLSDDSGQCKLPGTHEETVVTVEGIVYMLSKAVRVGPKSDAPEDCPSAATVQRIAPEDEGTEKKEEPASTVSTSQAKVQYNPSNGPVSGQVPVGSAYFYDGSFTVRHTHPLKVKSGIHRYSVFFPVDPPLTDVDKAEGLPRLGDRVHRFEYGVPEGPYKHPY